MNGSNLKTTVAKGNAFRDLVASMLDAAGFVAETETRSGSKGSMSGGGERTWTGRSNTSSRPGTVPGQLVSMNAVSS
jgi:hypothetical protein